MRTCWVACLLVGCGFSPSGGPADGPGDARVADAGVPDAGVPDADLGPDSTLPICPASYFAIGASSSLYRTSAGTADWYMAQASCLSDGDVGITGHTHLVVIDNEFERSATNAIVSGINVWIGLTDLVGEGTFLWVTAEPTAGYPPASGSPWAAGEPDGGVTEDCTLMAGDADFTDALCDAPQRFICECDAFPDDPSRY